MAVIVGDVKKVYSLPRALVGFQSASQFLSFLGVAVVGIGTLFLIQSIFGLSFMDPKIVLGALIGALVSVYAVLPHSFSFQCDSLDSIRGRIEDKLRKNGYINRGGQFRYESKLPRLLRWNENYVEIMDFGGGKFQVIGAPYPVRVVWRYLRNL